MNLYSRKQGWKIFLLVLAVLIVGASLWSTNMIVKKIAKEERQEVKLWAEAIQSKAKLVNSTNKLFEQLRAEERKKVEQWAQAMVRLVNEPGNLTFELKMVSDNTTVPVIITDEEGNVAFSRNLPPDVEGNEELIQQELELMAELHPPIDIHVYEDQKQFLYYKDSRIFAELQQVMDELISSFISETVINSASAPVVLTDSTKTIVKEHSNIDTLKISTPSLLEKQLAIMTAQNNPLEVDLGGGNVNYIFYEESLVLSQLRSYPYIQFTIIGFFLLIAYLLFSTFRKAEQNQVWVGMAKETAHQLGTPLSSLMAWVELLKEKNVDTDSLSEMKKDVNRLETITSRFSKIGSEPELKEEKIVTVVENTVNYLRPRISSKVDVKVILPEDPDLMVAVSKPLFSWVLENLIKNAVDAMSGNGNIIVQMSSTSDRVHIDVSDTGKGIPSGKHRTVFQPGFTTKARGWGLGLSLTKRIIENYHSGKIFVKSSSDQGTTFRISLKH